MDTAVTEHENSDGLKQKFGANVVEYCMSYIVLKEFFSNIWNKGKIVSQLNIVYCTCVCIYPQSQCHLSASTVVLM